MGSRTLNPGNSNINVQGSAEKDRQVNWQAGVVPPTKASSVCRESYSNTPFVVLEDFVCGLRFHLVKKRFHKIPRLMPFNVQTP